MDRRDFIRLAFLSPTFILSSSFANSTLSYPCYPKGIVYTEEYPGKWNDKVKSHVPQIKIDGRKVTVITPHPMSKRHYIVRHTLVSEDGQVLGDKTFYPEDPKPISIFYIPEGYKGKLYVTSFCNLHDFWLNETTI